MRTEQIGDSTLYLGDCLEVLPILGKVDAIVTDPPYAIPTQVASGRTVTRNVGDLSVVEAAFRLHSAEWKASVGDAGRVFTFCDGSSYSVMYRALYSRFNLAAMVWDKDRIGMGREFRKSHELIIHAWGAATKVVQSNGTGYRDMLTCRPVPSSRRLHPAQKPVALIEMLLRVCGEVIVDPFMGSASTGVACVRQGKRFIGIEIDIDNFDVACRRIEDAYKRKAML